MATELTTISETRKAVKKAKGVYFQARFGLSEQWIEVTKKAALAFLDTIPEDATPEEFNMFGGTCFAMIEDDGTVSLG